MTAPMSSETRALIVRRLRQEADRIEAGGEPRECVARGEDHGCEDFEDVAGARRGALDSLTREREQAWGQEWSGETESIHWGVVVAIEEARVVSRMCPSGTNASVDEVWEYGLVDAGAPDTKPPLDPCEDDDCDQCRPTCEVCAEPSDELDDEGFCPTCLDKDVTP